jgi:glycine oxidase
LSGKGARLLASGAIEVKEAHAGLRPGTPDRMPIIGRLADERLIAATGHYRNGILLAPLTAKMVADLVSGREPHALAAEVSPARFAGAAV